MRQIIKWTAGVIALLAALAQIASFLHDFERAERVPRYVADEMYGPAMCVDEDGFPRQPEPDESILGTRDHPYTLATFLEKHVHKVVYLDLFIINEHPAGEPVGCQPAWELDKDYTLNRLTLPLGGLMVLEIGFERTAPDSYSTLRATTTQITGNFLVKRADFISTGGTFATLAPADPVSPPK